MASPNANPYAGITGKEIDLRQEIYSLLYGSGEEIAKGRTGLLRIARIGDDGHPMRCECRDSVTDESSRDYFCPKCHGLGFYWDETEVTYFSNDSENPNPTFYIEYSHRPEDTDYLVTLKLDSEGSVSIPVTRDKFYKIDKVERFRSDNGRIEYIVLKTTYEPKWSTWYGVKHRKYG